MKKSTMYIIGGGLLLYFLAKSRPSLATATSPTHSVLSEVQQKQVSDTWSQAIKSGTQGQAIKEIEAITMKEAIAKAGGLTRFRASGIDPRISSGRIDYSKARYTPSREVAETRARTRDPARYPISARYG